MYLNRSKIIWSAIVATIELVVGILWLALFLFGFILALVDKTEDKMVGIACGIVGMLVFGPVILLGINNYIARSAATRLNIYFEVDTDGVIPAEELISVLRVKDEAGVLKKVGRFMGKGFLKSCTVDYANKKIILYRPGIGSNGGVYETVSCPGCGASGKRKKGYNYECPYCGKIIK